MLKYEVGKPLPIGQMPAPRQEQCRAVFDLAFFHILYWVPNDAALIAAWRHDVIRYGVFVRESVPFFLLELRGANRWQIEVSLNIKGVQPEEVEPWLNTKGNALNMVLCDMDTNDVLAMRMIGLRPDLTEVVRDTLEWQDHLYSSAPEVEAAIMRVTTQYHSEAMLRQTNMYPLKQT